MLDIGWSEMAIVLLVALIVIGPKDLPRLARNMGQWAAKGRAMAREFHRALEDMAREAELDKVKSEIEKAGRTDLGKTIEKTVDPSGELSRAFEPPVLSGQPAAGAQRVGGPTPEATAALAPAQPAASLATGAPTQSVAAIGAPAQPEASLATGAPTQPVAAAVAPAAPVAPATSAAPSNGAGAATPRKRAGRAPAPKAPVGSEPSTPPGNGTGAAADRKRPRRATAPTEPS
jgi:sec-independent protein translocase protein TatB